MQDAMIIQHLDSPPQRPTELVRSAACLNHAWIVSVRSPETGIDGWVARRLIERLGGDGNGAVA